jgi:hypothetical protein
LIDERRVGAKKSGIVQKSVLTGGLLSTKTAVEQRLKKSFGFGKQRNSLRL